MQKLLMLIITLFALLSCENEVLDNNVLNELKKNSISQTKSTSIPSPLSQLKGIPVNLVLAEYLNHDNRYLVRSGNGITLGNSTNPKWQIETGYNGQSWDLKVFGEDIKFSPATFSFRPVNDFMHGWYISNVSGSSLYNFWINKSDQTGGGLGFMYTSYLCAEGANSKNIKMSKQGDTGVLKNWQIVPGGNFELANIRYTLDPTDVFNAIPDYSDAIYITNPTDAIATVGASFTRRASETSNFSQTEGLVINTTISASVSIPGLSSSGLNVSTTTSASWTYGTSQTQDDTRNYSISIILPARSNFKVKISVSMFDTSATYIATYRDRITGREIVLSGKWYGIKAGIVHYTILDEKENILKSFSGIPTEPIEI